VASAKLAVLRTMRESVARRGWTLLGDDPDPADEVTEDNP